MAAPGFTCPHCAKPIGGWEVACPHCGKPITPAIGPPAAPVTPAAPAAKKGSTAQSLAGLIVILFVAWYAFGRGASPGGGSSGDGGGSGPNVAATRAPAKPASQFTISQQNAIDKAASYLDYSSFSRTGLIEQLEYEGFSKADATFAVDHITVDWNEQAWEKAKAYLDYSSFSRKGLIEQLEYEGFTNAQATYGVNKVGL
jgi:Host cell surface-exposed lipoprotein